MKRLNWGLRSTGIFTSRVPAAYNAAAFFAVKRLGIETVCQCGYKTVCSDNSKVSSKILPPPQCCNRLQGILLQRSLGKRIIFSKDDLAWPWKLAHAWLRCSRLRVLTKIESKRRRAVWVICPINLHPYSNWTRNRIGGIYILGVLPPKIEQLPKSTPPWLYRPENFGTRFLKRVNEWVWTAHAIKLQSI